jgi:hypothetical protein
MPKYYVQSGELELVTTASDPRAAAIWAVHRALAPTLPFVSEAPARRSLAALGHTLAVSQRGFDRADAEEFCTLEIMAEWNQLQLAFDRLEQQLAAV